MPIYFDPSTTRIQSSIKFSFFFVCFFHCIITIDPNIVYFNISMSLPAFMHIYVHENFLKQRTRHVEIECNEVLEKLVRKKYFHTLSERMYTCHYIDVYYIIAGITLYFLLSKLNSAISHRYSVTKKYNSLFIGIATICLFISVRVISKLICSDFRHSYEIRFNAYLIII